MNAIRILFVLSSLALPSCFLSPSNNDGKEVEHKSIHILWSYSYDLGGGSTRVLPLITGDGYLITSGDNSVTAVDYEKGNVMWKSSFNHNGALSNRRFALSENVIVGSIQRRVIAWDKTTGQELWNFAIQDPMSWSQFVGFTSSNGSVITYGREGDLYKFSKSGGMEILNYEIRIYDSTFESGQLYLNHGSIEGALFTSINSLTNEKVWQTEYKGFGFPAYTPSITENGIMYVGTAGGPADSQNGFFALNGATGKEIWQREGIQSYSAVLEGDFIYVYDGGGVHKFRKDNGSTVWHTNFGSSGAAPIAYGYGFVYAPHSGSMRILDAGTGEIVHTMSPPDGSYFWLVTADKGRIFAQTNRHLYAFAPWGHEEALE